MLNLTASMPEQDRDLAPQITVVGVGGAGCNAVNNMIASKLEGVRFLTCNTDAQALKHSLASSRIQLGTRITSGLGAGSKPEIGRAAAEESIEAIMSEIEGANMVFITAGMGGGTGTGAAPVIARAAKEAGILTVGVVTKPFHFEGAHRMRMAEAGLQEMQQYVDTLIVIPNQNLFRIANEKTTFAEAFKLADSVLQSGVRGVTDLMVMPGLINLDFADVRTAMMEMGKAMMGTGEATGDRRAVEAAERAINNPLLDDISMKGAKGVIINITGGFDMTLFEVDEACNRIRDEVDADANIIFGSTFDETLQGVMRVTVLATGIESESSRRARPVRPSNTVAQGTQTIQSQPAPMQMQMPQQAYAPQMAMPAPTAPTGPMEGLYGSATGMQQQLVVPPLTARVSAPAVAQQPVYAQEGATMRRIETGGGYQQQELGIAQSQPAQASTAADLSRGVRYGGAFIPPRPVDPEGARTFTASTAAQAASRQPMIEDDSAFMPEVAPQPKGLQLNPPVPGSKKRAPSLFDKITSIFTEGDEAEDEGKAGSASGDASSGGGIFSGFAAPRRVTPAVSVQPKQEPEMYVQRQPAPAPVVQPQAQTQNGQTDLEIPAFLRRQIS
ncbi:MAG: cell division protein FtsZ [Alphaproteobacteria bacterium]|nr:cell division protein FtsZ [Alphaproteobacteria bacterium]